MDILQCICIRWLPKLVNNNSEIFDLTILVVELDETTGTIYNLQILDFNEIDPQSKLITIKNLNYKFFLLYTKTRVFDGKLKFQHKTILKRVYSM